MYSQLPMLVSLRERERQRIEFLKDAEILRALNDGAAQSAELPRWMSAARKLRALGPKGWRIRPSGGGLLGQRPEPQARAIV